MSLDNIQLPPIVIQDLFKDCLIDVKSEQTSEHLPAASKRYYLGENKKGIIILVNHPESIYLPDNLLNLLLGILGACGLNMADVALLNMNKNPELTYKIVAEELKGEKIILFGVNAAAIELPLQFPAYQIQKFNNQVYLLAADLKIIELNKEEKLKLWNCLKQVFNIG